MIYTVIYMTENVLFLLKNKNEVNYLNSKTTIQEGLEQMKEHGFTSIPVIDDNGFYVGSISQGDFLWYLCEKKDMNKTIKKIIRKDYMKPATITTSLNDLLNVVVNQNYVPIVDDRNIFIGIVTRKSIIEYFLKKM